MLSGPDPLVVPHVLCDDTQDGLLHDLPQHQGQDDRPVAAQILLWPL